MHPVQVRLAAVTMLWQKHVFVMNRSWYSFIYKQEKMLSSMYIPVQVRKCVISRQ